MLRYNRALQLEVFNNLFSSLKTGGFLALGIKENLPMEKISVQIMTFNKKESIYKKH